MAAVPAPLSVDDFEDEEDLVPEDEIKERLNTILIGIENAGLFACHEQLKDARILAYTSKALERLLSLCRNERFIW
jgi:hypothetical protein